MLPERISLGSVVVADDTDEIVADRQLEIGSWAGAARR